MPPPEIWLEPGVLSTPMVRSSAKARRKVAPSAMVAVKRACAPTRASVRRSSPASMLKRRLSAAAVKATMPAPVLPTVPTPSPA